MTRQIPHHEELSKPDADARIVAASKGDGTFFTRKFKPGQFVLSVIYKGKPTQHLLTSADGNWLVNKKSLGNWQSVDDLIAGLKEPGVKGWPVPLTHMVPVPTKTASPGASEVASPPSRIHDNHVKPTIVGSGTPWLHPESTTREASIELVGTVDGTFMVRVKNVEPEEYALCVVYNSKATHHLISRVGGELCVNKKSYGANKTLGELIATLGSPGVKGWPVPLTVPVNYTQSKEELLSTFAKLNTDSDDTVLSWTELKEGKITSELKEVLRKAECTVEELFVALDNDGNNEITASEFIHGCAKLEAEAPIRRAKRAAAEKAEKEAAAAKEQAEKEAAAAKEQAEKEAAAAKEQAEKEAAAAKEQAEKEAAAAKEQAEKEAAAAKEQAEKEAAAAKEQTEREATAAKKLAEEEVAVATRLVEMGAAEKKKAEEAAAARRIAKEALAAREAEMARDSVAHDARPEDVIRKSIGSKSANDEAEDRAARFRKASASNVANDSPVLNTTQQWKLRKEAAAKAEAAAAEAKQEEIDPKYVGLPSWKVAILKRKKVAAAAAGRAAQETIVAARSSDNSFLEKTPLQLRREQKDREEREALAARHAEEARIAKEKAEAELAALKAEMEAFEASSKERAEEAAKVAAMPAWRQELYHKKKRGGPDTVGRMSGRSIALEANVEEKLRVRREKIAEAERVAEDAANRDLKERQARQQSEEEHWRAKIAEEERIKAELAVSEKRSAELAIEKQKHEEELASMQAKAERDRLAAEQKEEAERVVREREERERSLGHTSVPDHAGQATPIVSAAAAELLDAEMKQRHAHLQWLLHQHATVQRNIVGLREQAKGLPPRRRSPSSATVKKSAREPTRERSSSMVKTESTVKTALLSRIKTKAKSMRLKQGIASGTKEVTSNGVYVVKGIYVEKEGGFAHSDV